jgi:hypothetical protein
MKHFLTTLDDHLGWWAKKDGSLPSPGKMHDWDLGQIEIEHIYPQHPKAGEGDDELEPFMHSIGNLTIWAPGDNRAAKNDRFLLKRPSYQNSQSQMTKALGQIPNWDDKARQTRQADLIDLAIHVFTVDGMAEVVQTTETVPVTVDADSSPRYWFVQQNEDSIYRDSDGELYDYPYGIPNAQRIAAGDYLVTYVAARHAPDGRRITGIGHVDRIVGDGDRLLAVYDKHLGFDDALKFESIGGDPRTNRRNAMNQFPDDRVAELLAAAGVSNLEDLPGVEVDVEAVLQVATRSPLELVQVEAGEILYPLPSTPLRRVAEDVASYDA